MCVCGGAAVAVQRRGTGRMGLPQTGPQRVEAALTARSAGRGRTERLVFHARRWFLCFANGDLWLSYATLRGHQTIQPSAEGVPSTWEEVLLRTQTLLPTTARDGVTRQHARAAIGMLAHFSDLCSADRRPWSRSESLLRYRSSPKYLRELNK